MATIQQKPYEKPCGTCGEQGHHSRKCAMYLKKLRASFPFSWAYTLINDPHSVYIYLAQACLKLTGSDQVLAQQIWDIYVWYEKQEYHVTPQVFMKTVKDWNEFCSVAFALGDNLFRSNTQHFLTKKGCATWMQILKEKMGLPIWSSLNFHTDSDGDGYEHEQDILHWEDFLNEVSKAFTAYASSSCEWNNSLFSRIKPFQCNKCNEFGHKSNNCAK